MSFDFSSLPVSGGTVAAVAGYAFVSFFLSGPVIGERVIEKSGWPTRCERAVVAQAENAKPVLKSAPGPQIECGAVMSLFAVRDGEALCDAAGFLFENPAVRQIEAQNRRAVAAYHARVAQAAEEAGSQCACAVNVTLEDRLPFALYAGSLRQVEVSEVRNLDARLASALSSPLCAGGRS